MVKKKVDGRVRGLIEHGVRENHRSLFVLVGDHGKDQVENLHKVLSKTRVKVLYLIIVHDKLASYI